VNRPLDEPQRELLSAAGAARRRMILHAALRQADRRRRRRLAVRGGTVVGAGAAIAAILLFALPSSDRHTQPHQVVIEPKQVPSPPSTGPVDAKRTKVAPPAPPIIVEIIRADQIKPKWEIIDDDQLLAALASAGQPSGLVTLNGKTEIVPR
jgi:hypothetical protein